MLTVCATLPLPPPFSVPYRHNHAFPLQVYTSYARSHLYYAAELLMLAILLVLIETVVGCLPAFMPACLGACLPAWVARASLPCPARRCPALRPASLALGPACWRALSSPAQPAAHCLIPSSYHTFCNPSSHFHSQSYAGIVWSTYMVSVAILWAPFW